MSRLPAALTALLLLSTGVARAEEPAAEAPAEELAPEGPHADVPRRRARRGD
jgi:hypothetical protein